MLDMSVRAKILDLMIDLKDAARADVRLRHARPGDAPSSSATAWRSCTSAGSSRSGRVEQIFAEPKHPYTQALIRAIPEPDPDKALPRDLPRGEVPDAARAAAGLLVPPALPAGLRALRLGEPRPARDPRRALDQRRRGGLHHRARRCSATSRSSTIGSTRRSSRPARARTRASCVKMLEQIRAEEPDEPLWKGVKDDPRRGARRARDVRARDRPRALRHRRLAGRLPALQA